MFNKHTGIKGILCRFDICECQIFGPFSEALVKGCKKQWRHIHTHKMLTKECSSFIICMKQP